MFALCRYRDVFLSTVQQTKCDKRGMTYHNGLCHYCPTHNMTIMRGWVYMSFSSYRYTFMHNSSYQIDPVFPLLQVKCKKTFWTFNQGIEMFKMSQRLIFRDVTTGATGATAVAPKFSDTLTLIGMRGDTFISFTIIHIQFFVDFDSPTPWSNG